MQVVMRWTRDANPILRDRTQPPFSGHQLISQHRIIQQRYRDTKHEPKHATTQARSVTLAPRGPCKSAPAKETTEIDDLDSYLGEMASEGGGDVKMTPIIKQAGVVPEKKAEGEVGCGAWCGENAGCAKWGWHPEWGNGIFFRCLAR